MPRLPWHALALALALVALGLAAIPAAAAAAAVPVVTAKGGATSATVYFTPAATDDHYAIGIFRTSSSGTPINVDSSGNPTGLDIIYTCKSSQSPPGCVPLGGGTVQLPFADYYFALPTHEPFPGKYRFKVRAHGRQQHTYYRLVGAVYPRASFGRHRPVGGGGRPRRGAGHPLGGQRHRLHRGVLAGLAGRPGLPGGGCWTAQAPWWALWMSLPAT